MSDSQAADRPGVDDNAQGVDASEITVVPDRDEATEKPATKTTGDTGSSESSHPAGGTSETTNPIGAASRDVLTTHTTGDTPTATRGSDFASLPGFAYNNKAVFDPKSTDWSNFTAEKMLADYGDDKLAALDLGTSPYGGALAQATQDAANEATPGTAAGGGGDMFFPPVGDAQRYPGVQDAIDSFVTSVIAPLNEKTLNTSLGAFSAGGQVATDYQDSQTGVHDLGSWLAGDLPDGLKEMYPTGDKWRTDLSQARKDLIAATGMLGSTVSDQAGKPLAEGAHLGEHVGQLFTAAHDAGAQVIAQTMQTMDDKAGAVAATRCVSPSDQMAVLARAIDARNVRASVPPPDFGPITESLTTGIEQVALRQGGVIADATDKLVSDVDATNPRTVTSGGAAPAGKSTTTTTPSAGGGATAAGGGGAAVGGGMSLTGSSGSGAAAGSSGGSASGSSSANRRDVADKIADVIDKYVTKNAPTSTTGQAAGGWIPAMPQAPQFMSPLTSNSTIPGAGDLSAQSPYTQLSGEAANPLGGFGGQAGLFATGPWGTLTGQGGVQETSTGGVAGYATGGYQPPTSTSTTRPVGGATPVGGVSPTNPDHHEDTTTDGDTPSFTARVDGMTGEVTFDNKQIADMVANIADNATPEHPIGLLDAAREAGLPANDFGDMLHDPTQAKPGDLIVGELGNGVYLGDGQVLMETGEVKELADVLRIREPDSGVFRLDVGDGEADSPDDEGGEDAPHDEPDGDAPAIPEGDGAGGDTSSEAPADGAPVEEVSTPDTPPADAPADAPAEGAGEEQVPADPAPAEVAPPTGGAAPTEENPAPPAPAPEPEAPADIGDTTSSDDPDFHVGVHAEANLTVAGTPEATPPAETPAPTTEEPTPAEPAPDPEFESIDPDGPLARIGSRSYSGEAFH